MEAKSKRKYLWIAVISVVGVTAAWWFLFINLPGSIRQNGGVEALFTGLAFALLIVTAIMQKDELELQRKELVDTRTVFEKQQEQMEGQKEQLRIQSETQIKQQFEATFFQMLSLHHEIVKGLAWSDRTGRKCFEYFISQCNSYIEQVQGKSPGRQRIEIIQSGYGSFYSNYEAYIGHYFRNLYNILKYVDRGDMQNRMLYTNLLRAQLSGNELRLLFYNCLSRYGQEKTRPLIERYSLLENIGSIPHEEDKQLYNKIAFGINDFTYDELINFSIQFPQDYEKIKPRIDEEIGERQKRKEQVETPA